MAIVKVTHAARWEQVLKKFPHPSFLQSWEWGEFQTRLGHSTTRITINLKGHTVALAQAYLVRSKLASCYYIPRGPRALSRHSLTGMIKALKKQALTESADYLLIEPDIDIDPLSNSILSSQQLVKEQSTVQPANTLILPLSSEVLKIQSSFRKTTRAMIKKAVNSHVVIQSYGDFSPWPVFAKLLSETARRQGFLPHPFNYLETQLKCLLDRKMAHLYLAKINRRVVAGAIIIHFQKQAIYLHAASNNEGRQSGASQMLVSTAITDAKKAGCQEFDFWGIAPENSPRHPWAGITVFKKGFGGNVVSYPSAWVWPIHKNKYRLYRLITAFRATALFKNIQRMRFNTSTTAYRPGAKTRS